MEAYLSAIECDKCDEVMEKGRPVLVIAEGKIVKSYKREVDFLEFVHPLRLPP